MDSRCDEETKVLCPGAGTEQSWGSTEHVTKILGDMGQPRGRGPAA